LSEKKELPIHLVIKALERNVVDVPLGQPFFEDLHYNSFDLNTEYFSPLPKHTMERTISFVDGGTAEIIGAPNFSVGLNRVYFNLFKGEKRQEAKKLPQRIDFFTVCVAKPNSGQIVYETELVPLKEEWAAFLPDTSDLTFNSLESTLTTGSQRVPISLIIDIARMFSEWNLSQLVISNELEKGDVLVRDGTLQTIVLHEEKYAQRAYKAAVKKGVYFSALSKTSTLLTKTGLPLMSAINSLSEGSALSDDTWYYYPIFEINKPQHHAEMFAVKLHRRSEYVFRFEVLKEQVNKNNLADIGLIISSLAKNSMDFTFPGYPYGLIDADKFARVTGTEKRNNEFQLKSISGRMWRSISQCIKSSDAHEILNKIKR
jgi:hypothetical protein